MVNKETKKMDCGVVLLNLKKQWSVSFRMRQGIFLLMGISVQNLFHQTYFQDGIKISLKCPQVKGHWQCRYSVSCKQITLTFLSFLGTISEKQE